MFKSFEFSLQTQVVLPSDNPSDWCWKTLAVIMFPETA